MAAAAEAAGLKYDAVESIPQINKELRAAFLTGKTRSIEYRQNQLKQLAFMLQDNEDAFCEALNKDLGRHKFESMFAELMTTITEAVEAVHSVKSWAKKEKVSPGLAWGFHNPHVRREPKGTVLILGAWNYPLTVQIGPLIGAIAAGNTCVLKPSEVSAHSAKLISDLFPKYLDPECYRAVNGGIPQSTALLDCRWEHILYTGNGTVGRIVAEKAAKWLCPTTLELGGKSPTWVDETADLPIAAKRILWGKQFNVGQTCVAPDYVLCTKKVQSQLVAEFKKAADQFWPKGQEAATDQQSKMVNEGHWKRVKGMLEGTNGKIVLGGPPEDNKSQSRAFPLVVVSDVKPDDSIMTGEIFGPVLPIVAVQNVDEAIQFINSRDQPLALYSFSANSDKLIENCRSGGVLTGDILLHNAVGSLPFGGTGPSGYGAYHGKWGFDEFSHKRAVLEAPHRGIMGHAVEMLMKGRYPPYNIKNLSMLGFLAGKKANFARPKNPHASVTKPNSSGLVRKLVYLVALLSLVLGARSRGLITAF
ncbi:aldehyde dehydrogenase [Jaminaea rosea]|uniref:Aldehyde dehydrogenase n=1 Tax=Jaminaea rosea TaxID=1569628 RepID=A0A316V198_9BASI|nr:aldehyde dehydrogenase [Jaminaea rosea]PWN29185.1 aldehyde dehydrogenase [Jaminaea rosea]